MPDIKLYYERYLVAAMGLATLAVSLLLSVASESAKEAAISPPAAGKGEPFTATPEVESLKSDFAAMDQKRGLRESTNGASPFVSRIYLLKDGRLVDILESGNNLFPGIPNHWVLENGLDYLDPSLPARDLDEDGFTNAEEFAAKTSPREAVEHPPEWTKLRLLEAQEQPLAFVLKNAQSEPAFVTGFTAGEHVSIAELTASGDYDNPPDDENGNPRQNPPSFLNKTVEVQLAQGIFSRGTVVKETIDKNSMKFTVSVRLECSGNNSDLIQGYVNQAQTDPSKSKIHPELVLGAWINSQSAEFPGKTRGQSMKCLLGQELYINTFVSGRATPKSEPASFKLARIQTETRDAPELGADEKKDVYCALIESTEEDGKSTELEENLSQKSPSSVAILQDIRPGGPTYTVSTGKEFTMRGGATYKLIDVSQEKATLSDPATKQQHSVPKGQNVDFETTGSASTEQPK